MIRFLIDADLPRLFIRPTMLPHSVDSGFPRELAQFRFRNPLINGASLAPYVQPCAADAICEAQRRMRLRVRCGRLLWPNSTPRVS